jgi:hypothetical protein
MLARARVNAPRARLALGVAEHLPWHIRPGLLYQRLFAYAQDEHEMNWVEASVPAFPDQLAVPPTHSQSTPEPAAR